MKYIKKDVPLWTVTIWDKKYKNVNSDWQPQTIKYSYLLSDALDKCKRPDGDIRILYTGKEVGYTFEELVSDYVNEGEIIAIPWGGIPTVKYFKGKFITGDNRIATSSIPTELLNKYIYYFMLSRLQTIASFYRGTGLKHPSMKEILKLKISYPCVAEQNIIIQQFDAVETVIKCLEDQLTLCDELIESAFLEMFGDAENNPNNYPRLQLNDICTSIVRGPFGSSLKKAFFVEKSETTYKVYEQQHAIKKSADIGNYYITEEKYNELKRFECFAGDFIMSCSGTMGEIYQLPEECERGIINQALCKFSLNKEMVLPIYFLTYMKMTIDALETKGSGIKNIAAVSFVKALPINCPPLDEQLKFSAFVDTIDSLKSEIISRIELYKEIFSNKLKECFGEE